MSSLSVELLRLTLTIHALHIFAAKTHESSEKMLTQAEGADRFLPATRNIITELE
ncbi:MAG TPA: hypothetical protein VE863_12385 [Pyrinomonadaceae bacterium]|nr:hypothetical protein [Pyrinomonadaceae bacterium]